MEAPLQNEQQKRQMLDWLDEYFGRSKKFINTDRIPLICQDIFNIHQRIEKIDINLKEIKTTNDIQYKGIQEMFEKFEAKFENKYETKESADPVKKILYGFVGLIIVGVATAAINLILK